MEKLKSGAIKLGIHLSSRQLGIFETYYQELVDWNKKINLTSIIKYEDVQVTHFLDSLTIVMALKPPSGSSGFSVIDVGTGAGLPGIPLTILWPNIKLVLLEATAKKARFLNHLVVKLRLDNVEIVEGRAEEIAHNTRYRDEFHVVLSRAVAVLPTLAELTLPFCKVGGVFIVQKKGDIEKEVGQSFKAITLLGGSVRVVKEVNLEEFDDKRWLVVIDKVKPTPAEYPRRTGMPAKRPIGL